MAKGDAIVALAVGGALAVGIGLAVAYAQPPPPPGQRGTLTVSSTPGGIPIQVNGASQLTPFSQTYDAGTAISITVPATATIAGQGYTFQQWSDGSTSLTQTG